jgi:hypothetical protein
MPPLPKALKAADHRNDGGKHKAPLIPPGHEVMLLTALTI